MKHPNKKLRWYAFFSILLTVLLTYLLDMISYSTIKDITYQHPSLFTPAGFTFSIWGVIYFSWVAYGVYQLLPASQNKQICDSLAAPLIISSLLGIVWGIFYRTDKLAISEIIMIFLLVTAIVQFAIARRGVLKHGYSNWLSVPFSLYAGWISVATIANTSVWLVAAGFEGGETGAVNYTLGLVVVAALLGAIIGFAFKDFIFPLVIGWACLGIGVDRYAEYPFLAYVCYTCAIIMALVALALVPIYFTYKKKWVEEKRLDNVGAI